MSGESSYSEGGVDQRCVLSTVGVYDSVYAPDSASDNAALMRVNGTRRTPNDRIGVFGPDLDVHEEQPRRSQTKIIGTRERTRARR